MNIDQIFEDVQNCKFKKTCYGEDISIFIPVPGEEYGRENIDVMFIEIRPGREGTKMSGKVSYYNDDPTAELFRECCEQLGLKLETTKFFCTNICLCIPTENSYTDTDPDFIKIKNCNFWLKEQIKVLNPKLIITLGKIPLKSMKYLYSDSEELKKFISKPLQNNIGKIIKDTKPWIYPPYHTAERARSTRSIEEQKNDWLKIKDILIEIKYSKLLLLK